ncbi:MAG: hypothetical protein AAGA55_02200 [Planctomycetota bacterium]
MPANRSRTERWRECLAQICERGGGLEFAIDQGPDRDLSDLIWRVHVYGIEGDSILIEHPGSMGQSFPIQIGAPLIGIMAVGQNRWMFRSRVTASETLATRHGPRRALRVQAPTEVERCSRRTVGRTSTLGVNMPSIECWPLLDPRSAAPIEVANRVQITDLLASGGVVGPTNDEIALPEVGPKFLARLANIGGGGVGLVVPKQSHATMDSITPYFLRIDLRPTVPAPIFLTARVAHTHMDSQQNTYAGMSFDFSQCQEHKSFVVGQIARYVGSMGARRAA